MKTSDRVGKLVEGINWDKVKNPNGGTYEKPDSSPRPKPTPNPKVKDKEAESKGNLTNNEIQTLKDILR